MKRIAVFAFAVLVALTGVSVPVSAAAGRSFRTAIYVVVNSTRELADRATFERQYARVAAQMHFDKVYIESYRGHMFASDADIEKVKGYFREKGIAVAGGVTLAAGGKGGQFGTFDYEDAADRAECRKAAEQAARHFDEVILDDFFFYTTKSEADIVAKGTASWTEYRLNTMRKAAADLVVGPAHKVNPKVRVVIKYPNWYEHFQGLGFDLEKEPEIFDGVYTGTESRDPTLTDQLLQQYESYEIFRYYSHLRADGAVGGNGGGWIDTGSLRSVDRYTEQLRDTLLAKAPEITLFNWYDVIGPRPQLRPWGIAPDDERNWVDKEAYRAMRAGYRQSASAFPGGAVPGPGWARVADYALAKAAPVIAAIGHPVGIVAYKPYHSRGEDFLQNYLGNCGFPIEMVTRFPETRQLVLLTETAAQDPDILTKIKRHLRAGGNVVVTVGFLRATQDKGFRDIVEWETTGAVAMVGEFLNGFGAGNGVSLNDAGVVPDPVLFADVRFYTNDSWAIIRGVAGAKGYPILLSNTYGAGTIYLLNLPQNPADMYRLPQGLLTQIKTYLQPDAQVRLQGPALTSLFAYDNGTFVAANYRGARTNVTMSVSGKVRALRDLVSGKKLLPTPQGASVPTQWGGANGSERTVFAAEIGAHDIAAFAIEK